MKFSDFAREYNNIFLNVSLWKWHRGSPIWKRKKIPKSLHSLFLMWTTFSLRIRASLVLKYSMSPPQQTQTHSNILFQTPGKSKYFLKRMQFFPTWYYSGKRSQQQPPMPPPLSPLTALPPFFAIGGLLFVYCSQTLLSRTKEIVPGFAPFPSKTRR